MTMIHSKSRLWFLFGLVIMTLTGLVDSTPPAQASTTPTFAQVRTFTDGRQIFSPAPREIWAGNSTALERYVGGKWTNIPLPKGVEGLANYSSAESNEVWGLDNTRFLWHYNGSTWTSVQQPPNPPSSPEVFIYGPTHVLDVPGPGVYVAFIAANQGTVQSLFGYYDGTTWIMLPIPTAHSGGDQIENVWNMAFRDGSLVVLGTGYRGNQEWIQSYTNGLWSEPALVGVFGTDFSIGKWTNDWVVTSPTDIWLYGNDRGDGLKPMVPWCAHFTGSSVIGEHVPTQTCVTGSAAGKTSGMAIDESTGLANNQHVVASSNQMSLLTQPNHQTPMAMPRKFPTFEVVDLVTEPRTNTAWALVTTKKGYQLLRYTGGPVCAKPKKC